MAGNRHVRKKENMVEQECFTQCLHGVCQFLARSHDNYDLAHELCPTPYCFLLVSSQGVLWVPYVMKTPLFFMH